MAKTKRTEINRRYRLKHRDAILAKEAEHRKLNRDEIRIKHKAWSEANRGRRREHGRRMLFKRYGLTPEEVLRLYESQNRECALCRFEISDSNVGKHRVLIDFSSASRPFQIDHVIPKSRGGTDSKENLRLVCGPCNLGKGQMTDIEYFSHCERVVQLWYGRVGHASGSWGKL